MPSYFEFSYVLTDRETLDGLQLTGAYKKSMGKRAIVETVLLAVMFLFFSGNFIVKRQISDLLFAGLCVLLVGLLHFLPRMQIRKQAAQGEKNLSLRVYPERIYVYIKEKTVQIPLHADTKLQVSKDKELMTLEPENGTLLILPKRAIPEEAREKVLERIGRISNLSENAASE